MNRWSQGARGTEVIGAGNASRGPARATVVGRRPLRPSHQQPMRLLPFGDGCEQCGELHQQIKCPPGLLYQEPAWVGRR